jgi:CRISPR type III-B/RAMP module-associated protein Cmr3
MNLKDLNIDEKDLLFTEDRAGIGLDYQKLARGDRGTMEGRFYVTPFIRCNENIGFYFSSSEKLKPTAHKIGSESHPVCLAAIGTDQQNMLEQLSEQSRRHLVKAICRTRTFRLVLLQPGIFKDGWMPFPYEVQNDSLIATIPEIGLRLKLLFACLDLPLTISGYSFAANREKVRQETLSLKRQVKAIPAGSVYFFQMESETSESSIRDLVQRLDNKKIPYEPFSKIGFNHAILACGPEPVEPCN